MVNDVPECTREALVHTKTKGWPHSFGTWRKGDCVVAPTIFRYLRRCRGATNRITMRKELEAAPIDIHLLAEEACRAAAKSAKVAENGGSKRHENLQAGLARVRGVAVQRAKAANVRMRRRAVGGTALGFGVGIAMGLLASRVRSVMQQGAAASAEC